MSRPYKDHPDAELPPPSADPICGGCFLYERRGVCPAAHDAYGLENSAVAESRAEQFRQAVAQDAQSVVSLAELVRIETERQVLGAPLPGSRRSALPGPAAASDVIPTDSRKEAVRVSVASPDQ